MSLDFLVNIPGYEEIPIQVPPPGVTPNFVHPESTAWQVYIVSGICTVALFCVAAIRFHIKRNVLKIQTKDDVVHYVAISLAIIYFMLATVLAHVGIIGVHAWDLKLKNFTVPYLRLAMALIFAYSPIIWIAKVPLFLMYLNIFEHIKWLRYLIWTVLVVTALVFTITGAGTAVMCSPPVGTGQSQLDFLSALTSSTCGQSLYFGYLQSAVTLGTDVFLMAVPMPIIWSLRLSTQRKIGMSALILIGLLGCGCSCLSILYRIHAQIVDQGTDGDSTWRLTPLLISGESEMACALTVAAAPSLSSFCRKVVAPLVSRLTSSYSRLLRSKKSSVGGSEESAGNTSQLDPRGEEKIWQTPELPATVHTRVYYGR